MGKFLKRDLRSINNKRGLIKFSPLLFCPTIDDNHYSDNLYRPIAESRSEWLKITKMGILRIGTEDIL